MNCNHYLLENNFQQNILSIKMKGNDVVNLFFGYP